MSGLVPPCFYTKGQIGWLDTDNDGVYDILDFSPNTDLNEYLPDPTGDNTPTCEGIGFIDEDNVCGDEPEENCGDQENYDVLKNKNNDWIGSGYGIRNPCACDITLNRIHKVEWQYQEQGEDPSDWMEVNPDNPPFGDVEEPFSFVSDNQFSDGYYTFKVRATSTNGFVQGEENCAEGDSDTLVIAHGDAPEILWGGYGDTLLYVTEEGELCGHLELHAQVYDVSGLEDIDRVEVYFNGAPFPPEVPWELQYDEMTGVFVFEYELCPEMKSSMRESETMPIRNYGYLETLEEWMELPYQSVFLETEDNLNFPEYVALPPQIKSAGYQHTLLYTDGGILTMTAYVVPDPEHKPDHLDIFTGGLDTGAQLRDDGTQGDKYANDGVYTLKMRFAGVLPPVGYYLFTLRSPAEGEEYYEWPYIPVTAGGSPDCHNLCLLELVATDLSGDQSDRWPYLWVHDPEIHAQGFLPFPNFIGVPATTDISLEIVDEVEGVDPESIVLTVNEEAVEFDLIEVRDGYRVVHVPLEPFDESQIVTVTVDAMDLAIPQNDMVQFVYSFTIDGGEAKK